MLHFTHLVQTPHLLHLVREAHLLSLPRAPHPSPGASPLPWALSLPQTLRVLATGLAAVAAVASWAAVRQSRQAFKSERMPLLEASWVEEDREVVLEIHNTGAGFARMPFFYVIGGSCEVHGYLTDGRPMPPGEGLRIRTELPRREDGEQPTGVVLCIDVSGTWQVWSCDGRHRELRNRLRRTPRRIRPEQALELMHPETAGASYTNVKWHPDGEAKPRYA